MNPKFVTQEELLKLATPILSGLLASGHFTESESEHIDGPLAFRHDRGKDWKEDGFDSPTYFPAVSEAVFLAEALIRECETHANYYAALQTATHPTNPVKV